jgi:tetraacyldisaccharide 4'-kinase
MPVICIGNLTVGGAGKTPITRAIRAKLGANAHTLSRGYGGRIAGPLRVTPDMAAREVGDEPLAARARWRSLDRARSLAGAMAAAQAGAHAIIMDDGFQNPALAKDLSIIAVDPGYGVGNGQVFPAGPLRERSPTASRAPTPSLCCTAPAVDAREPPGGSRLFTKPILTRGSNPPASRPTEPVAFAGLARPEKFFDTLTAMGGKVSEAVPFADHHPYSRSRLGMLAQMAEERDARLITTEKDAARLSPEWRARVAVLPVAARFADEAALGSLARADPIADDSAAWLSRSRTILGSASRRWRGTLMSAASARSAWSAPRVGAALSCQRSRLFSSAWKTALRNIKMCVPGRDRRVAPLRARGDPSSELGRMTGEFPHMGKFLDQYRSGELRISKAKRSSKPRSARAPSSSAAISPIGRSPRSASRRVDPESHFTYRPANNPIIDKYIVDTRAGFGLTLQAAKGKEGGMGLLRSLKQGPRHRADERSKIQCRPRRAVLRHDCMTADGPTRLALKFKVPLIPITGRRIEGTKFVATAYPIQFRSITTTRQTSRLSSTASSA